MNLIEGTEALDNWGIYSLGYNTSMMPDVRGIWAGNTDLAKLSSYMRTTLEHEPLDGYSSLAITAHSMGGLVAQRALIDDTELANRTAYLTMFGTPSAGLRKAGWLRFLNTQARDMDDDGRFVTDLRERWSDNFGDQPPFQLRVLAGDRDEFVPASSSLAPFGENVRAVVPGNHIQIVAPEDTDALSYKLLASILGGGDVSGLADPAAIAVELGEFQTAVSALMPHADELDDQHLVLLALALEGVGRPEEALDVLENREDAGTDAVGVLAGRLKRRWMTEGRDADGKRSLELYSGALTSALTRSDTQQAFYHAINAAFMTWAYGQDSNGARAHAQTALDQAESDPAARWAAATEGEAHLYLGNVEMALESYRRALRSGHGPRELRSIYQQAAWASHLLDDQDVEQSIDQLFVTQT